MSTLSAHHALITGGGSGIGAAIAKRLHAAGARVSLVGRTRERLEHTAAELGERAIYAVGDVADAASLGGALDQVRAVHGPVSILINNAGIAPTAPFHRTDEALWQTVLGTNLHGTYQAIRLLQTELMAAPSARIINISSTAGLRGYGYASAYCAAKHAVIGLTRALAREFARSSLTVNAVCPGFTDTAIVTRAVDLIQARSGRSADETVAALVADNPQGRLVTPEEVAETVHWLCLPGSAAVNGRSIAVDGGELP
jgi:NAD(P)-dependent dehydrogenase (short-subunit alcohol dehydrogenase family)